MKKAVLAIVLGTATLVALAAPVPAKKKLDPPTEDELKASAKNLKQIGIAYHSYVDTYGRCPDNILDGDNKPILSWRVVLLPYLEEEKLFKEFKLDEPWDSKTNKPLIEKLPKVYKPIRVTAEKGETFYRGFCCRDSTFEPAPRGNKKFPASFPDGTSNTLLAFEAGEPCIWSKPDDLGDAKAALPKLGGLFEGDFHALMCDGSVYLGKSTKLDADQFRRLITRNDGFVVDREKALGIEKK